jgi:CheY-like chemotaxis protein
MELLHTTADRKRRQIWRKTMGGKKILCVENEPENLAILTCMLEGIGYEVMPAMTSDEAIGLIVAEAIDGVLLEYNLPDESVSALRAELKQIQPDIPVLLFEGVGSQTPFMVRFLDAYLRNAERNKDGPGEFES